MHTRKCLTILYNIIKIYERTIHAEMYISVTSPIYL